MVGMTPNGATVVSATLSGAGIVLLATLEPSLAMSVAVAVLLAAGYVMDSVDGQLARLRGRGSVRGEWFDHTVDCFKTSSLHLVVAISWFRFPPVGDRAWLLVPLGFTVVSAVTYFGLVLMPYLRMQGGAGASPDRERAGVSEHALRKWLILPTDYGFLCWVFVLLAWQEVFLVVYTALFGLAAMMLALALRKWWRELGALDGVRP
jgi:phosphatidylglycerophosphate synthase